MIQKHSEIDFSLVTKMKMKVVFILFILVFSPTAYAEDNPFKLFDNHNFYKNKKSGIKPDGKIGDTCLEISPYITGIVFNPPSPSLYEKLLISLII